MIVQAYYADHHAIKAACEHDFASFAAEELAYRRVMNYPPYSSMALLLAKDRVFERARAQADLAARALREGGGSDLQVLGPSPAPLEKLRREYRVQVIVRSHGRRRMREALAGMLAGFEERRQRLPGLSIDVDPMTTL